MNRGTGHARLGRIEVHSVCYSRVSASDPATQLHAYKTPNRCKEGKMKERKHALNEKKLVGVTCASTKQEILANQEFPIVILDESSQVNISM